MAYRVPHTQLDFAMPTHHEKRELPFSPTQLFDLVADIGRYPEFLPWCKGARIIERSEDLCRADLIIGYKMFREKFSSVVTLQRPQKISVQYVSGPLSNLSNEWRFEDAKGGGCNLYFDVDFDLRSPLLAGVMELFFEKAISRMAAAFEERAYALYGKK